MQFGITFEKLLLIGVIAALLIGPDRLPGYAETFARLVRKAGEYLRDTKTRVKEEMGEDMPDVDWRKLDPRQYDPRRIIRDALFEDPAPAAPASAAAAASTVAAMNAAGATTARPEPAAPAVFSRETPPPFDPEAT